MDGTESNDHIYGMTALLKTSYKVYVLKFPSPDNSAMLGTSL